VNPFPTCKITVLKTLYHPELAEQYRREDVHQGPCPYFKEATSSLQASCGAVLIGSNGTMEVVSATEEWQEALDMLCIELGNPGRCSLSGISHGRDAVQRSCAIHADKPGREPGEHPGVGTSDLGLC